MRVLLTGGNGDLGMVLTPLLLERGESVVILDPAQPKYPSEARFIQGSVLDRDRLPDYFAGCDLVVHIAAWHGIHEFRKEKTAYDFFDLNVKGTFEVFEAAVQAGIRKVIFISSTSISDNNTIYGHSKIIAEQFASFYATHYGINVITLRPRAFIPHWNNLVYSDYIEWAKWFWKGAVHIDDVAQSVIKSVEYLENHSQGVNLIFTVDGAYEYSDRDLERWDSEGPGSTFRRYYAEFYDLAIESGLAPDQPPRKLDITNTGKTLNYEPKYSLKNLLQDLKRFGKNGPPFPHH